MIHLPKAYMFQTIPTVAARIAGGVFTAIQLTAALAADPACAHLTISDVKKMGIELLEANRAWLPQFFG